MSEHRRQPDSEESPAPLDSATVILVRESPPGPWELLLLRRHRAQEFMGGAYVFPGGRLDEADCDPGLPSCARGLGPLQAGRLLQEESLAEPMAIGLFFAAIRETFEEAGVLLACDGAGMPIRFEDTATAARLSSCRRRLHQGEISLRDLAEQEGLFYTLDRLLPYAHWITPEIETRRFDTRFLLARHPEGQVPVHDAVETTRTLWISPAAALEQHRQGRVLLMPPTLKTIEELDAFRSVDALFQAARCRRIHPILPQAFSSPQGFGVKLPHDPEYTIAAYKLPDRPGEASRIVMRNGIWATARPVPE